MEEAVGADRRVVFVRRLPEPIREAPAGRLHDRLHGGDVVRRDTDGVHGDIHRAFRDQHVLPEIADTTRSSGPLLEPNQSEDAAMVEVPLKVVGERLGNRKQGTLFIYDTEIFVYVRARNRDRMEAEIERLSADLRAEIRGLWRTSDPRHFEEPGLETLTRQVTALISERAGNDPVSGEPYILRAVVSMMPGFRADP